MNIQKEYYSGKDIIVGRTKKIIITFAIVGLLLVLLFSYVLYFQEYFSYKSVLTERTITACIYYINIYQNGRYIKEVNIIFDDLLFEQALQKKENGECSYAGEYINKTDKNSKHLDEAKILFEDCLYNNTIRIKDNLKELREFLVRYPNGKYSEEIKEKFNEKLKQVVSRTETAAKLHSGSGNNMKELSRFLSEVAKPECGRYQIRFNKTYELKEWTDFKLSNEIISILNKGDASTKSIKGVKSLKESPPIELTKLIKKHSSSYEEYRIKKLFINAVEEYLGSGIATFDTSYTVKDTVPVIYVNYTIKNDVINAAGYTIPSIYIASKKDKYSLLEYDKNLKVIANGEFEYYYLSVMITYTIEIFYPDNKKSLFASGIIIPEKKYDDLETKETVYDKVLNSLFNNTYKAIQAKLGMEDI
jgi:hypothetical protein